jgi:hypothetical protein
MRKVAVGYAIRLTGVSNKNLPSRILGFLEEVHYCVIGWTTSATLVSNQYAARSIKTKRTLWVAEVR